QFTGGEGEIELEVSSVRELLRVLGERYPALESHLGSVAVAIDRQIYQDAWLEPIPPDSEVHLIPQIAGGSRGPAPGARPVASSSRRPRSKLRIGPRSCF